MTNKQIQKNLVKDMKQDESLKEYAKDIKELNEKSFSVLIKVLKKLQKSFKISVCSLYLF